MATALVNLVKGNNKFVCVYSISVSGRNSIQLAIPSTLRYGRLIIDAPNISGLSVTPIATAGPVTVIDIAKIAGKTLSFEILSTLFNHTLNVYYSGYNGDEIVTPPVIPSSNISMSLLNEQIRQDASTTFSMDQYMSRVLAKKPSGIISFADYKTNRIVERAIPEVYFIPGGGYGSDTSYSSWSSYTNYRTGFGMLSGLNVYLIASVAGGNADALGIEIYIANKYDTSKCVHLSASYGSGGNNKGTHTLNRDLTQTEINTLGGANTELVWKRRIWGNTGGLTLYAFFGMVLTPKM